MSESFSMESQSVLAGSGGEWEERYRRGDTPWEKGAAHPALLAWLESNLVAGRVLVPGCGLGHDVRALAKAGADVVGLDVARLAIAAAQTFPRQSSEMYLEGDLFDPGAFRDQFDWVFEHTCFCAIQPDRRADYVRRVSELLKPGGHLLAIFFLNPEYDESDAGGPPFGCGLDELNALFSPRFQLVVQLENLPTFPGREGREVLCLLRRY